MLTISGTGAMADYTCPSNAAPWYEERSVTIIDVSAFEKCSSLETVYYSGTREQWNAVTIGEENENLMNAALMFINPGAKMKPSLPEGTTVVE